MRGFTWERVAAMLICIVLGGALSGLALRYAIPILLPFLLAWLISLPLSPLARTLSVRLHLSKKLCAAVLLTAFVGLGSWGLVVLLWRLILEAGHLLEKLLSGGGLLDSIEGVILWIESVWAKFPFLHRGNGGLREGIYGMLRELLSGVLTSVSAAIPTWAAGLFSAIPTVFFVSIISILAGYYFCVDGERIKRTVIGCLPSGIRSRLSAWKKGGVGMFRAYLKAYLLLLLLTFSLLFFGFCILGVSPAFLIALLVAVLDLLPVIGVGTVMIPWSLILLIQKDYFMGFGLLILYLIVELVRQVAEPKLLGHTLGLHPVSTLFATYAGFYCFGFLGMLLAPIAALLLKSVVGSVKHQREGDK